MTASIADGRLSNDSAWITLLPAAPVTPERDDVRRTKEGKERKIKTSGCGINSRGGTILYLWFMHVKTIGKSDF